MKQYLFIVLLFCACQQNRNHTLEHANAFLDKSKFVPISIIDIVGKYYQTSGGSEYIILKEDSTFEIGAHTDVIVEDRPRSTMHGKYYLLSDSIIFFCDSYEYEKDVPPEKVRKFNSDLNRRLYLYKATTWYSQSVFLKIDSSLYLFNYRLIQSLKHNPEHLNNPTKGYPVDFYLIAPFKRFNK